MHPPLTRFDCPNCVQHETSESELEYDNYSISKELILPFLAFNF